MAAITVESIAIGGDWAAARLTNGHVLQLRRAATGEWLIDGFGEPGLPAELRRKLLGAVLVKPRERA